MQRTGYTKAIWIVIAVVVLAGMAVLVSSMFGGQLSDIESILGPEGESGKRSTCRNQVTAFCQPYDNEKSWVEEFPDCEEYVGEVFRGETCGELEAP